MRIIETITPEYIQTVWNNCLIFLKNIKRVQNGNQLFQVNAAVWKWYKNEFEPKISKNTFAIRQSIETPAGLMTKATKEFEDYILKAFIPNAADIVKYFQNQTSEISVPTANEARMEIDLLSQSARSNVYDERTKVLWENAYYVLTKIAQSKYVGIKKKIDEYFQKLIDFVSPGDAIIEKYITDEVKVDNIPLQIHYVEGQDELVKNVIYSMKKAFALLRANKLSKALNDIHFMLDTTSTSGNAQVQTVGGKSQGYIAAYYSAKGIVINGNTIRDVNWLSYHLIPHELGHHFFAMMTGDQRKLWYNFVQSDFESKGNPLEVTKEQANEFYIKGSEISRKYRDEKNEFQNTLQYNQPKDIKKDLIKRFPNFVNLSEFLSYEFKDLKPWYTSFLSRHADKVENTIKNTLIEVDAKDYQKDWGVLSPRAISEIVMNISSLMNEIAGKNGAEGTYRNAPSQYAQTNPEEYFTEVFTAYCNRQTIGRDSYHFYQAAFEKFIEVTGVRSATHESKIITTSEFVEAFVNEKII